MQILYSSPFLQICYYPEQAALETKWLAAYPHGLILREALLKALHLARTHRIRHWIANQKKMRTIRLSDQEWIKAYWLPRLKLLDLATLSIIVSDDVMNRLGIHNITQCLPLPIADRLHYLDTVEAALRHAGAEVKAQA